MIVITTFNGKNYLERLLEELSKLNLHGHSVLIIDSGTNEIESIDYLNFLKKNKNNFNFNITVDKTHFPNYDSGVIHHALKYYDDSSYIFIHDSSSIKNEECLLKINNILSNNENSVIPFIIFKETNWPSEEQKEFAEKNYGIKNNDYGIFASMFSITKKTANKIDLETLVLPKNKEESRAMERCWSIIFDKYNINVVPLEGYYNHDDVVNDKYRYFRKILASRQ